MILLDDDPSGIREAARYRAEWFLPKDAVLTLRDIDPSLKGKALEGLISKEGLEIVRKVLQLSATPSKKQLAHYFAEMNALNRDLDCLDQETAKRLRKVVEGLSEKIK